MTDMVQVHLTADMPIRLRALKFADRVEVRIGKAFPIALLIDRPALETLKHALTEGQQELDTHETEETA